MSIYASLGECRARKRGYGNDGRKVSDIHVVTWFFEPYHPFRRLPRRSVSKGKKSVGTIELFLDSNSLISMKASEVVSNFVRCWPDSAQETAAGRAFRPSARELHH